MRERNWKATAFDFISGKWTLTNISIDVGTTMEQFPESTGTIIFFHPKADGEEEEHVNEGNGDGEDDGGRNDGHNDHKDDDKEKDDDEEKPDKMDENEDDKSKHDSWWFAWLWGAQLVFWWFLRVATWKNKRDTWYNTNGRGENWDHT